MTARCSSTKAQRLKSSGIALSPYGPACGVFNRPAALKAVAQHGSAHAKTPSALGDCHGFAAPRDRDIFSGVAVLNGPCSPTAIFGRITTFIVNAIKSIPFARVFAHVFKKVGKSQPPVADSDSTSAIIPIRSYVWIQAAAFHVSPCPIGPALFHGNICSALAK